MSRSRVLSVERLRWEINRWLAQGAPATKLVPLLGRLARAAVPNSEPWVFAHRHLAELCVEEHPWRAALFARRVFQVQPDDDGAWALFGLALSLLGNHAAAACAYERAVALAPNNPFYAHNLGHLYDVVFDRPQQALPLLERACRGALLQTRLDVTGAPRGESGSRGKSSSRSADTGGKQPMKSSTGRERSIAPSEISRERTQIEVVASYAHALARCGEVERARRVLKRCMKRTTSPEHEELLRWLDEGAPTMLADCKPAQVGAATGLRGVSASQASTSSPDSRSSSNDATPRVSSGSSSGRAPRSQRGATSRAKAAPMSSPPNPPRGAPSRRRRSPEKG